MIEIKQIQTGIRQFTTVDNRDSLGHRGWVDQTIEVEGAEEDIDETEDVDVMVFGVPFVGIVVATSPPTTNSYNSVGIRDYTIKLVAKDGYDYTQFLKPDWGDDDDRN